MWQPVVAVTVRKCIRGRRAPWELVSRVQRGSANGVSGAAALQSADRAGVRSAARAQSQEQRRATSARKERRLLPAGDRHALSSTVPSARGRPGRLAANLAAVVSSNASGPSGDILRTTDANALRRHAWSKKRTATLMTALTAMTSDNGLHGDRARRLVVPELSCARATSESLGKAERCARRARRRSSVTLVPARRSIVRSLHGRNGRRLVRSPAVADRSRARARSCSSLSSAGRNARQ